MTPWGASGHRLAVGAVGGTAEIVAAFCRKIARGLTE